MTTAVVGPVKDLARAKRGMSPLLSAGDRAGVAIIVL